MSEWIKGEFVPFDIGYIGKPTLPDIDPGGGGDVPENMATTDTEQTFTAGKNYSIEGIGEFPFSSQPMKVEVESDSVIITQGNGSTASIPISVNPEVEKLPYSMSYTDSTLSLLDKDGNVLSSVVIEGSTQSNLFGIMTRDD